MQSDIYVGKTHATILHVWPCPRSGPGPFSSGICDLLCAALHLFVRFIVMILLARFPLLYLYSRLRPFHLRLNTFLILLLQTVQEMVMLSTSVLNIKWTIKGRPKSFIGVIGGDLIIKVNSQFTLNQISGQVIEHEEVWDLSASSIVGQLFFWTSRRLSATVEAGRDLGDLIKNSTRRASTESENLDLRPDLSGDPTKFFQSEDSFQRDTYQVALFLAVLYFVVQFLRTIL
uniref:Uncharacterized protein n=1 Tax=Rhizophora mucronata TaxID=61149 RepID=A0A2P2K0A6_RHIMU